MINLKELHLRNFLSHKDTSLHFSDYTGLVLIEGKNQDGHYSSNGSGKSTILEGIVYALTGDTLRGVAVNDVINRNYKKNTKASLYFSKDDVAYSTERYRKDDTFGDSLMLYRGEEDISKRINKETQKSLDDILSISYKVLVSTMLLGEGLSSRFTQLSDPEKKSLIESTLNLNYDISAIRNKASSSLNQLKLEKSNLEGRLSALRELVSIDIDKLKEQMSQDLANEVKASEELTRLTSSLQSLQERRADIERRLQLLVSSIHQHSIYDTQINSMQAEKLRYTQELLNSKSTEYPVCPVCHQSLTSHESLSAVEESYMQKIQDITGDMNRLIGEKANLPDISLLIQARDKLQSELSAMDAENININNAISMTNQEVWRLRSSIDQAEDIIEDQKEYASDISSLEDKYSQVSRDIDKYEYFYKLFSPTGIIVNILSDAIEYINGRLSTYSEVLLEKDYKINFLKGKISLVDSKGASYQSLSNGEKRRLDIAIQFALHDYVHMYCGNSVDTLFLDEVLDTLDDVGIDNIITVLRLKLDYCHLSRIFVISHNSELKSYFDKVITIVKDQSGDSKIEN